MIQKIGYFVTRVIEEHCLKVFGYTEVCCAQSKGFSSPPNFSIISKPNLNQRLNETPESCVGSAEEELEASAYCPSTTDRPFTVNPSLVTVTGLSLIHS